MRFDDDLSILAGMDLAAECQHSAWPLPARTLPRDKWCFFDSSFRLNHEAFQSIGLPLTGNSLGGALMVDGVNNKANVRFCRLAWWYSFPRSRCSVWISLASARSRLHLWHGPYGCSHHAGCRRDLAASAAWQIGHTAGTISAAPQDVAVAAQLQAWMLTRVFGEHVRTISEHFWIDGGAKCGEGARPPCFGRARTAPRLAALVHQRKPCHSRASIHVPSSLLKAKGIQCHE
jgi:hypothetical protein